jgi:hypothetical protein
MPQPFWLIEAVQERGGSISLEPFEERAQGELKRLSSLGLLLLITHALGFPLTRRFGISRLQRFVFPGHFILSNLSIIALGPYWSIGAPVWQFNDDRFV